jgi:YVTN family beta-propeller protein
MFLFELSGGQSRIFGAFLGVSARVSFMLTVLFLHRSVAMAQSGSLALSDITAELLAVNPDSHSVSVFDVRSGIRKRAEVSIQGIPQAITIDSNSRTAFVTSRQSNTLEVIALETDSLAGCVEVGAAPFGVASDTNYIYVANQKSDSVSVIHRSSFLTLLTIDVDPDPRGLRLDAQSGLLYVTHFFTGDVSVIDTQRMLVTGRISVNSSANISQSLILDHDRQRAYLPQTFSNSANQSLLFDTTVFPVVTSLDLLSRTEMRANRIALDVVDQPVGIPLDAVMDSSDKLFVANSASNDVTVIDLATSRGLANLEVGANPRGLAFDPASNRIFVNNTLSGTLSVIDAETLQVTDEVQNTDIPLAQPLLNGKRIFNDSSRPELARDNWIACATCHFDGEHDGRTWFFADGPRNSPSLLGVADTPPFHWSGDLDELHDVELAIRVTQAGTGLTSGPSNCVPACDQAPSNRGRSQDLDDLVLYLASLQFEQASTSMSVSALRGQMLFSSETVGCAQCHIPPTYTDGLRHDVGTGTGPLERKGKLFDTPSLRGINRTAPYFHDGSAKSLEVMFSAMNASGLHGKTANLTASEFTDLLAFLNSIEAAPESGLDVCEKPAALGADATAELVLNQQEFQPGEHLSLSAHSAGSQSVDFYVLVALPDGALASFASPENALLPGELVPLAENVDLGEGFSVRLVDTVLDSSVPAGVYQLYAVAVPAGEALLNQDAWLAFEQLEFEIRPSD